MMTLLDILVASGVIIVFLLVTVHISISEKEK